MDYGTAFDISAAGMRFQMQRLETVALNLANANTVAGPNGLYQPKRVVGSPGEIQSFALQLGDAVRRVDLAGVGPEIEIEALQVEPRRVHDPTHPAADADGYVQYPNVNPVSEMLNMIQSTRAYEANVRALNAAKAMAQSALEIGR